MPTTMSFRSMLGRTLMLREATGFNIGDRVVVEARENAIEATPRAPPADGTADPPARHRRPARAAPPTRPRGTADPPARHRRPARAAPPTRVNGDSVPGG